MFDDEKIDFIESLPECDAILVIWFKLLTLAGKCNAGGYILLTENIAYTDEMLAHKFRRPLNIVRMALATFKKLEMISFDGNEIYLSNFEKHQNLEKLEKLRQQTRNRVSKHREKSKELMAPSQQETCTSSDDVTQNVTHDVTQCNATDIDIDKELDIDKEKDIYIMSQDQKAFIDVLAKIKNYPLDLQKDIDMYHRLTERYPNLDLIESIKDWSTYKIDKPLKPKDNPRSQINTSFKNYVEWNRNIKKWGTSSAEPSGNSERKRNFGF